MKPGMANNNRAFTCPQWLLIICLAVVAFEVGVRFAESQKPPPSPPPPPLAQATNLFTNVWMMAYDDDPLGPPVNTNTVEETNGTPLIVELSVAEPYDTWVGPGGRTGGPQLLKDGPTTRRSLPRGPTNDVTPRFSKEQVPAFGIRISVP